MPRWLAGSNLPTDEGATYARRVDHRRGLAGADGDVRNESRHGHSDYGPIPDARLVGRSDRTQSDLEKALKYMALEPGKPLAGHPVDVVFIGSCTNSRISDLRAAAPMMKGRKVNPKVRVLVVPGSQQVKKQAIEEGLDKIFRDGGRRVPRGGLLHVPCHERRSVGAGPIQRFHQQSQFRRTAGQGRPHVPGQSANRGGIRYRGRGCRSANLRKGTSETYEDRHHRKQNIVIPIENIDTDQIIPARYLKTTSMEGLGDGLFSTGATTPTVAEAGLSVKPAGGGGRADTRHRRQLRLRQFARARSVGADAVRIQAVISTSFADIFRGNSLKNGLLPVVVPPDVHKELLASDGKKVKVDLDAQTLTLPSGKEFDFPIDPFARQCLLEGVDELG